MKNRYTTILTTFLFICIWFNTLIASVTLPVIPEMNEGGGQRTKSFTVNKGGMLDVSVGGGVIRITPWDKQEVYIKVTGIEEEDLDDLKMKQSGNTIYIEFKPSWGSGWSDVTFDVNVPAQFNADMRTAGGNIEIHGAMNGEINGSTAGGDIRLSDIVGQVDMSTSGGDIRTENIQGDTRLKTSGGDIQLGTVNGEADVKTSGGDIRIKSVGKSLKAKTSGGEIIIGDVGGEANVSTAGGDISVGKVSGSASLSTAGGDIELRSASGTVSAKTAGGNLRLENVTGSVEGKTAGGDIRAELYPGGKGNSRLINSGGDIKLYIAEGAKATIDARLRVQGWLWIAGQKKEYDIRSDFKPSSFDDDDEDEIRAKYVLNGGGENITLETTNGNIDIRRLRK
mgnify:FL=1